MHNSRVTLRRLPTGRSVKSMTNTLADALSPYLRQHASNPVNWQQWGAAPFAEAAKRDVPVFVSIGYSTCHWCHVMARESFSDPAIARLINENFVAIKVDREEHPEVDSAYLTAASAFSQNLGWPLNVFVTPQGKTFFAGTYWPPEELGGHQSFRQVLGAVTNAWVDRREQVEANAADVAEAIHALRSSSPNPLPDRAQLDEIVALIAKSEDAEFGGLGTSPKFPMVPVIEFLLHHGSGESLGLAERTLTAMADSGLRDPVDGGFFRYATRRDWTEPHYERMLYDNAQLLHSYADLAQRVPERAEEARVTAEYLVHFLLGTLRLPGGGFASAQNSESIIDGQLSEGGFYALTRAERAKEVAPALDDKVLTGWNGLALGALASAGSIFGRDEWLDAARSLADHLLSSQMKENGELVRATLGGKPSTAGATLEDYGLLAVGLLHLGRASGQVRWALEAKRLVDACVTLAGFVTPGGGDPVLEGFGIDAGVDPTEGALPSGSSALAEAARLLYLLTGERGYWDLSVQTMEPLAMMAAQQPLGFGSALAVMSSLTAPPIHTVVVGRQRNAALARTALTATPLGGICVIVTPSSALEWVAAGFTLFDEKTMQGENPTAYVCRDFVCQLPVTDDADLARLYSQVGNQ